MGPQNWTKVAKRHVLENARGKNKQNFLR